MSEVIISNGSPKGVAASDPPKPFSPSVSRRRAATGKTRAAQPYDGLLWRLLARRDSATHDSIVVGVMGCEPKAGATTIAANLAVRTSALQQGPVLLIEANHIRPRLASAWKLRPGPGLAGLLAGEASLGECLRDGPASDLKVLPAGATDHAAAPAWGPEVVAALLAEASADFRFVLFDLPPAGQSNDAVLLARQLNQVLLVVRAEQSRGPAVQRVTDQLLDDGVAVTGVVLNRERSYVPRWLNRWI